MSLSRSALMRAALVPVVFWAAMAMAITPARGEKLLRMKFTEGQVFKVHTLTEVTSRANLKGKEYTTEQVNTIDSLQTTGPTDANGLTELVTKFERVQMSNQAIDGQGYEYDSKSTDPPAGQAAVLGAIFGTILEHELHTWVDDRGETKKSDGDTVVAAVLEAHPQLATRIRQVVSDENLKQLAGTSPALLPEQALTPGQEWTENRTMVMPLIDKQKAVYKYVYVGPTQHEGKTVDKITYTVELTINVPQNLPFQLKVLKQDIQGTMLIDENGRIIQSDMKQLMTLDIRAQNDQVEQEITTRSEHLMTPADQAGPATAPE